MHETFARKHANYPLHLTQRRKSATVELAMTQRLRFFLNGRITERLSPAEKDRNRSIVTLDAARGIGYIALAREICDWCPSSREPTPLTFVAMGPRAWARVLRQAFPSKSKP